MLVATLDMFLLPAVTYAAMYTSPCSDWCVVFVLWSQCWIYITVITIHVGLRGYAAFFINSVFRSWKDFVPRLNQYHKYAVKGIVTGATLTLGFFGDLDNVHVDRWRVRLFGFSTTGVLTYPDFSSCECGDVWNFYNRCLDIQLNVLLQCRSTRN